MNGRQARAGRRGFQLLEVLLAVALVGGPLVMMVSALVQSSRTAARLETRAAAEQMLVEWSEHVARLDRTAADQLAAGGFAEWLAAVVEHHLELMPPAAQEAHRQLVQPLVRTAGLSVQGGTPGRSGLATVTLSARCADGQALTVARLVWFRSAGAAPAGFAE